mgnify:CR=1 FL=1
MRLFDTAFIVDLTNEEPAAAAIATKVDQERSFAAISVISVHEYLFGVHHTYRHDSEKLAVKLASARRDLSRFEILPLIREIVELSAQLHAGLETSGWVIGINDVYIAATALHYNLTLVTRDTQHFGRIDQLKIESY